MKKFFLYLLASIIGALIAFALFFFFAVGSISSAFKNKAEVNVKPKSVIIARFDMPISDRAIVNPLSSIDKNGIFVDPSTSGLNNILSAIQTAADDANIKGIYLDLSDSQIDVTSAEELRQALQEFKSSGKFVVSYADNYSQSAYYLASMADKIFLDPFGNAMFMGIAAQTMSYKKLLDKLDIEMQVIRHGKFKSAVEPFINEKISDENREQISTFINSTWNFIIGEIAQARGINKDSINIWTDNLTLSTAQMAVDKGLVDETKTKKQVIEYLCTLLDAKSEKDMNSVSMDDYINGLVDKKTNFKYDKVAVIFAEGEIYSGTEGEIASTTLSQTIREVAADSTIKSVVFRINSPGGDAQASEIIAKELEQLKMHKPLVISMGAYAASGGYWVSTPGDVILADHTTITGSIGVFGLMPNIKKGLENHLGILTDVVKTNEHSDLMSIVRPMNDKERVVLTEMVEDIYTKFIDKVSASRKMSRQAVDSIGQGRVWNAVDAKRIGLIDDFGGLTDAIAVAAEKANLGEKYRVIEMPELKTSFFDQIFGNFSSKATLIDNPLLDALNKYKSAIKTFTQPGIKARLQYDLIIKL